MMVGWRPPSNGSLANTSTSAPSTSAVNGGAANSSLVFTLPISCQICLSKVKEPVICSNRHVFCKICMDVWLLRNNQCPACRITIDEANPLRSILGGLSVMEEEGDDGDGIVDIEKVKAARNSKKNLRKARIELLFSEYEEEIQDLREELKEAKEETGKTNDELRDVKKALSAARKRNHCQSSPDRPNGSSRSRDVNTIALLSELTAKLKEAKDTNSKVMKDVDSLKKENAELKEEKETLGFEVSRLKSRLQLRSPAKMGRYATVAMETEAASAKKEIERLKKALEQADANVEKMQKEQEHLKLFHRFCHDDACPLSAVANSFDDASASALSSVDQAQSNAIVDSDSEHRPACSTSVLSLPDSPSTTLGQLSLLSPTPLTTRAIGAPGASRCMRNLFATEPARARDSRASGSDSLRTSKAAASAAHTASAASTSRTAAPLDFPSTIAADILDDSSESSTRFSLPSTSSFPVSTTRAVDQGARVSANEEPSEVDVSLEPDVQDCLSLIRAAERKIRRSQEAATNESEERRGVACEAQPSIASSALVSSCVTGPSIASSSTHSRSSSSAATDSTVISIAFSSSSSSSFPAPTSTMAPSWSRSESINASSMIPDHVDDDDNGAVGRADFGAGRGNPRSLKREISQGEMPSNKNFKQ